MRRRKFIKVIAVGATALPLAPHVARTQAYPTRPICLVVPFPPGGAFDAIGRPWADKMKSLLGTVVVENIGGGGSSLGAAAVARARPDGYTILLGGTLPHINEALLKSKPLYDPVKDLDPIASAAANSVSPCIHQCRLRPSKSLSRMPRLIPASCPTDTPVWVRWQRPDWRIVQIARWNT